MVGRVAPLIIIPQTAFMFMRNHPKSGLHRISPTCFRAIIYFGLIADWNLLLIKVRWSRRQTPHGCLLSFLLSVVGQTIQQSWKSIRVDRSITHQHETAFGGLNPFVHYVLLEVLQAPWNITEEQFVCSKQRSLNSDHDFFFCVCVCWKLNY